jgi:hypothetical protein
MVVALDEYTKRQVQMWGSVAVFVQLSGVEEQKALQTGGSHSVSGKLTHKPTDCMFDRAKRKVKFWVSL